MTLLASGQVLDTNGNAVTSGGQALYYFSDGNGGLYAATTEEDDHVLEITPQIDVDGTTSYTVEVTGLIDANTDQSTTGLKAVLTEVTYVTQTTTQTETVNLGSLANKLYQPDGTPLGLTTTSGLKIEFFGYKDGEGNGAHTVYDQQITTATDVQKSEQGIGVDSNFIDNADGDGAGEMLKMVFSKNVTYLNITVDQLDAGETAYYSIDGGSTWLSITGNTQGGSTGSDQSITVDSTTGFTSILFKAAEGSDYSILAGDITVSYQTTTEVPVSTDHEYQVNVIDVTGTDQQISLQADAVDGDGDSLASPVDFSVMLDSPITYDAVQVNGSTVDGFSVAQGDQLDFSDVFADLGMDAGALASGGYLTVSVDSAHNTATISVDFDASNTAYASTQVVTLTNLDSGVTASDIINQIITQQPTP